MKMPKLVLCLAACLILSLPTYAQRKERRRGKYIRTEIRHTDHTPSFDFKITASTGSFSKISFKKTDVMTHHEVRLYEVLLEIVKENQGEGITPRGTVEYILVPGETYEGEKSTRQEIADNGPLANETIQLNGKNITTDANGLFIDTSQRILELFDNLSLRSIKLTAKHASLGTKSIEVTRNLIKRQPVNLPGKPRDYSVDLLTAFGQDYTQLRTSDINGLKVKAVFPNNAKPGDTIPVTIEADNKGPKPVCNLIARSFSSIPEVNGKTFYFGSIQPGKQASFSRLFRIPDNAQGPLYATIAFWSILGPAPTKAVNVNINITP